MIAKLLIKDLKLIATRKPIKINARAVTGVVKLTVARIAVLKEKILTMTRVQKKKLLKKLKAEIRRIRAVAEKRARLYAKVYKIITKNSEINDRMIR